MNVAALRVAEAAIKKARVNGEKISRGRARDFSHWVQAGFRAGFAWCVDNVAVRTDEEEIQKLEGIIRDAHLRLNILLNNTNAPTVEGLPDHETPEHKEGWEAGAAAVQSWLCSIIDPRVSVESLLPDSEVRDRDDVSAGIDAGVGEGNTELAGEKDASSCGSRENSSLDSVVSGPLAEAGGGLSAGDRVDSIPDSDGMPMDQDTVGDEVEARR